MSMYRTMLRAELQRTLTQVQLDTLREVCRRSGCSVAFLAECMGVRQNAMHNRVNTLAGRGFVELTGHGRSSGRRRTVRVSPTSEGQIVVDLLGR